MEEHGSRKRRGILRNVFTSKPKYRPADHAIPIFVFQRCSTWRKRLEMGQPCFAALILVCLEL